MTSPRSELLDVYRHAGKTLVTVYLPTPSAVEDAGQQLEIRKKNLRSTLQTSIASAETVAHIQAALEHLDHDEGAAHVLVADDAGVVYSGQINRPVSRAVAHVGPCPHLLPLLAATQPDTTHLAVIIDRTGADVMLRDGVGDPLEDFEVDGSRERIHRSHPGGWSQRRFQQTAENNWESNAKEVVEEIIDKYPDVNLVVCGGDVRALGFFVKHLPARVQSHQVDGSRQSDRDSFLDDADVVLRTLAATQIVQVIDEWQSARSALRGSTGLEVLDHLANGRVEHLLVLNDASEANRATSWFNFSTDPPAWQPNQRNGGAGVEAPLTDAAVALAAATGATISVVPSHRDIKEGLAAIHRF